MAGKQVIYNGQDFSLKGEKNRFVLPPAFRKVVAESSDGKILCLAKHERWNCLAGFGLSRKPELEGVLASEEARGKPDFDVDIRRHQLFSFEEIPFDASGRFIMPQYLVGVGSLTEGVFFQGAGTHFMLWSPDELYRMDERWSAAQAACRMLAAESKGKKG